MNIYVIVSAQEFKRDYIPKCFLANDTYLEDLRMFSIVGIFHYTVYQLPPQ